MWKEIIHKLTKTQTPGSDVEAARGVSRGGVAQREHSRGGDRRQESRKGVVTQAASETGRKRGSCKGVVTQAAWITGRSVSICLRKTNKETDSQRVE